MNAAQNFFRGLPTVGLVLLTLLIFPARLRAEPTTESFTNSNEALRSYLQLQEQLHNTQQALERNRQETEELAAKNAAAVEAKLKALEAAMNNQRSAEWKSMQETVQGNNSLMLIVGGAIAGVGFFVLLATGYLQWRAVNRLAEVSAQVQSSRLTLPAATPLLAAGEAGQSADRLYGALTQMEKRIKELEHTAQPAIDAHALTAATHTATNGNGVEHESVHATHDSVLLAKGQSLLNLEKPAEALVCFEEILQTEPNHGEALVKKGIALEELERPEEALRCYDQAIAANADLTIAYLQKGGLFNRLERFEEALQCYERALHAQEKAHAA